MANPIPSSYFPGVALTANNELEFSTAGSAGTKSFPLLTDAEANPSTGDIREMAYAILSAINQNHNLMVSRPVQANVNTGTSSGEFPEYFRSITIELNLAPSGDEQLLPEP
jgi:hypothetical protein